MRNLIILTSLILLFFSSCDKEKASLNLVEGQDFKVAEITLLGATSDVTFTPTDAFLRFRDCSSSQNADNNCTLTVELDGSLFSFSYQAQGEQGNEFASIRQGQIPDGNNTETTDLLNALTYTFKVDQTNDVMELSCVDCPTTYQGQVVNERYIRLDK